MRYLLLPIDSALATIGASQQAPSLEKQRGAQQRNYTLTAVDRVSSKAYFRDLKKVCFTLLLDSLL